jgi:hypothetical protein
MTFRMQIRAAKKVWQKFLGTVTKIHVYSSAGCTFQHYLSEKVNKRKKISTIIK